MPRESIDLRHQIERLSILDQDGNLDRELEPDLEEETLRRLYRAMSLSRHFDERLLTLQRQGRIGTFAPVKGQEAAQLGAVAAIGEDDWMVPSFRETAAAVWRQASLESLIVLNAGFNEGARIPEDVHDLPITIPVASQLPHAVGIAYALKYRQADQVVLAFCGDGATSEGDFHEALNLAGVLALPVVFLCQNNQWAISVPREKQTRSETLAQKALAYGFAGIQVDGNDLLAVYAASREAVERARAGDGPTLIEAVTYRLSLHTTADDPSKYRSDEEVERWEERDPLPRFRKYLVEKGVMDEEAADQIEGEVKEEIEAAWQAAKQQMDELGDPREMFEHVWQEVPPYVEEQRRQLERLGQLEQDERS